MRIIQSSNELRAAHRKVRVAIGFFDGVHLGHQQIIRQTLMDARQHDSLSLVLTFDRHPNMVVAPSRVPPLIYTPSQKFRAVEALGVDALLVMRFDKEKSRQSGEDFVRELVRDIAELRGICVGANFTFGYKRGGNVDLLKKLGSELGFVVHGMSALSLDGRAVSSTRIREEIGRGNLDAASQMLGRAYALAGNVVRGDGLGRELGFPTANLDVTGMAVPPTGVYAASIDIGGRNYRAVLNIGYRPTLRQPQPQFRVEAHLPGFQGDLYGTELEVVILEKMRDERRFSSLSELKEQIARDVAAALKLS